MIGEHITVHIMVRTSAQDPSNFNADPDLDPHEKLDPDPRPSYFFKFKNKFKVCNEFYFFRLILLDNS